jgi:mono/diheme cytochrome c family protein
MPYTSYTYMTDADGLAIKAYLFSLPAVHATAPDNTFSFPFNQRWLMMFWSTLFNANARFAPNSDRSPEWNRGAYIAEALAHCGDCHTPRNLGLALDNGKKFVGAVTAGWHAFNITSDQGSGIGGWSDDEVSPIWQPDMRWVAAQRPAPWAKPSIKVSARWRHPTFVRWSAMCAAFRPSPRPTCRRRSPHRRRPRLRRPYDAECGGQKDLRRILRELPQLDRRERDHPLCDSGRRPRRQRSHRHQCRPDRDLRNEAAHAVRRRVDAGLRQHALRQRNSGRQQLCDGAVWQCAIRHHRP